MQALKLLKRIDWYIAIPAAYLAAIGFVLQISIANKATGIPVDINVATQVAGAIAALVVVGVVQTFGLLKKSYVPMLVFGISILMLVLVPIVGVEANGSQRWIAIGGVQLQPTEFAKLGLILVLAALFNTRDTAVNRLTKIFQSLIYTVVPAALILLQPDLGSAVVLFVIWTAIVFVSRLRLGRMALIMIALTGAVAVMVPFMAEYQQERLISYFNPDQDTEGANYNVVQAGIAIGSGGLTGTGIDSGSQSQLNFLPSQHTDFIFAVTAEKLGLIGAMSVIIGFAMITMRMIYLSWLTTNQFERGLLVGIVALIFFHAFVNIGMNLGLVPVTGLPLPLLSHGGTFMFVAVLLLGIAATTGSTITRRAKSK